MIAWLALALGVVNLIVWAAVVVAARRLWVKLSPQVAPLIAMFGPAQLAPDADDALIRVLVTDEGEG